MTINFLRDLVHNLNNSLTIMEFNFDNLEKSLFKNKFLKNIFFEQEVISNSLKNHLLLLELDNRKIKFKKINLSKFLQKNISKYFLILENRFNYSIEENIYVKWEINLIHFSIKELINNAIKHSNKKSKINLFLHKEEKKIVLEIQNDSKWFLKSEETLIFNKYYRW